MTPPPIGKGERFLWKDRSTETKRLNLFWVLKNTNRIPIWTMEQIVHLGAVNVVDQYCSLEDIDSFAFLSADSFSWETFPGRQPYKDKKLRPQDSKALIKVHFLGKVCRGEK